MGNNVPRISLKQVQLMPGNVIIEVSSDHKRQAQSASAGEYTHYHYLIKAGTTPTQLNPADSP